MDYKFYFIILLHVSFTESIPTAPKKFAFNKRQAYHMKFHPGDIKSNREFRSNFFKPRNLDQIHFGSKRPKHLRSRSHTFYDSRNSLPRKFLYSNDGIRSDYESLIVDGSMLAKNLNEIKVIPKQSKEAISVLENEKGKVIAINLENGGHEIQVLPDEGSVSIPELQEPKKDNLPNSCDPNLKGSCSTSENELRNLNGANFLEIDEPQVLNVPTSVFVEGSGDELDIKSIDRIQANDGNGRAGRFIKLFADNNETATPCVTPSGEPGHCRHFRRCILHEVLNNFNMYLQYMCLRSTSIGICCPDNPVVEISNPDDKNTDTSLIELKPFQPEGGCGMDTRTRIVGGTVSNPHEWTWMVALLRRNRFFCGGVLINSRYVLTAAHCTLGVNIKQLTVRLGEYNFNTKMEHQEDIAVSDIKRHAKFTTLTFQHDIALLKLRRQVAFSRGVQSICLPLDESQDFSGINATVVGWGTVSFGGAASPILRQVTIPVWKNSECDRTYIWENIDDSFLCAGSPDEEQDACQGDSGGPLMSLNEQERWQVIGLVSWGRRCGDPNYPGVYTRITTYLEWINDNMQM